MRVKEATIPHELKEYDQWVNWVYANRNGKRTKPPIDSNSDNWPNPKKPAHAKSDNPDTWSSYDTAVATLKQHELSGVGFVFTKEDPFSGIDIDKCRDPETGVIEPWATDIINRAKSYTEISPSETGVKIFLKAKLPGNRRRKGKVEMYDSLRYFTVTGQHLQGTPLTIEQRQDGLTDLYNEVFERKLAGSKKSTTQNRSNYQRLTDVETLEKARRAKNGSKFDQLWRGHWGDDYPSQSEADLALCQILAYWTGSDANHIDNLFRQSGLVRPKWDEKHYSDGRTYGQVTIEKAIANTREHYNPNNKINSGKAASSGAVPGNRQSEEWPNIKTLPQVTPEVPELPSNLIPEPLRGWTVDVAERLSVPLEFSVIPAVVGLAAVIGRKLGIHPKRHDDWLVVPNLWGSIVARPGMLKTAAIEEGLRPLKRLAVEASKEYELSVSENAAAFAVHKAKLKSVEDKMRKAAKEGKEEELQRLQEEYVELNRKAEEIRATERRYIVNDTTTEKLGELLNENPNGLLLYRDELSGWLRSLDKVGREGDREFYLESWNGTNKYTVDRIGRGTQHIEALCLSIVGGIQPGKLETYVRESVKGGWGDDGLLQRLQLTVWPVCPSWKKVDRWPNTAEMDRGYRVYGRLDQLLPLTLGVPQSKYSSIPAVHFDPDGQELFDAWRDELETRLRGGDLAPAFESHLAKYRSLMPSLALIFHLVNLVDGSTDSLEVSLAATRQAAAWCEFLEAHATKLYAGVLHADLQSAHALAQNIEERKVTDKMSVRSIYRHQWSLLTSPEEVEMALVVLEECNWVRIERVQTDGRPSDMVRLHPSLRRSA